MRAASLKFRPPAQIIDAGGVQAVKNTLQYHSGDPQVAKLAVDDETVLGNLRPCEWCCIRLRQVAISALQMINELAKHEGCKDRARSKQKP